MTQPTCPRCGRPITASIYRCDCGRGTKYFERDPTLPIPEKFQLRLRRREAGVPDIGEIHEPVVYYMRMDRLVKIGTSTNLAARMLAIQPQGVMAVEIGSCDVERQRHRQFAGQRSHGEWFWLNAELWDHIAALREMLIASKTIDEWLRDHSIRTVPWREDAEAGP